MKKLFLSGFVALLLLASTGCWFIRDQQDPGSGETVTPPPVWYGVYFTEPDSPEASFYRGGPADRLVEAIKSAKVSIDVATYNFNLWAVRDALLDANSRGVTVRLVTDSDSISEPELQELLEEGIEVIGDRSDSLMHNKFFIIDRLDVLTGSMNPTVGGAYFDNNNLVRLQNSRLAELYTREFEEMFVDKTFGRASPVSRSEGKISYQDALIEVYFSPEDHTADRIVQLIHEARESIFFLAYSFTSDEIAEALIERAQAGIQIAGVMERSQYRSNQGTEFDRLRAAGIDVLLDRSPNNMHHKVIIFDNRIVITGSYNFSRSAEEKNDENTLILHQRQIAEAFSEEFQRMFEQAQD